MPKRKQNKKWAWIGLLPGLVGVGWAARRWFNRSRGPASIQRRAAPPITIWDKAITPDKDAAQVEEIPQVAVTGAPQPQLGVKGENVSNRENANQPSERDHVTENREAWSNREDTEIESRQHAVPAYEKSLKDQRGHPERFSGETSPETTGEETVLPAGHALASHSAETISFFVLLIPFVALLIAIIALAAYRTPVQSSVAVPGGDPERGRVALQSWGCGSCHTIPGVTGADGKVGPNLNEVGLHNFIAGHLNNTPENMMLWIMHPQEVSPGNGMPDTGVADATARDMAAYLYSLNSQNRSSSLNFNRR